MIATSSKKHKEVVIVPLISDDAHTLCASSHLPTHVIYREYRIKAMLNIVSFVRECCIAKRVGGHC